MRFIVALAVLASVAGASGGCCGCKDERAAPAGTTSPQTTRDRQGGENPGYRDHGAGSLPPADVRPPVKTDTPPIRSVPDPIDLERPAPK